MRTILIFYIGNKYFNVFEPCTWGTTIWNENNKIVSPTNVISNVNKFSQTWTLQGQKKKKTDMHSEGRKAHEAAAPNKELDTTKKF